MIKLTAVCGAVIFAATASSIVVSTARAGAPIVVDVNNQAIVFQGTSPVEVNGSVLVPLRGVFEALGASVDYDAATKTITANKGASNVVLQLGSTTASVGGQPQTLSQPAQVVSGSTLVPLRFVAQALGATVDWNEATSTVEIYTTVANLTPLVPVGPVHVIGPVLDVNSTDEPQRLTVRSKGRETIIFVSSITSFQLSGPGQSPRPSALEQIKPGDQVDITMDPSGVAQLVAATYGEIRGKVVSTGKLANDDRIITLDGGATVELAKRLEVIMGGRPSRYTDIKPGQNVIIRTNPTDSVGYEIEVGRGER